MFVLCTLAVLTLHDLLRRWSHREVETSGGASGSLGKKSLKVCRRGGRGGGDDSRRPGQPDCKHRKQQLRLTSFEQMKFHTTRSSLSTGAAVLRSAQPGGHVQHQKDLGPRPRPCLELWKKDISLDASSLDFLMSDGEDDASFLSLPSLSHRPSLSAELSETSAPSQQLLIQTLQDKVCEFQARLRSEEVSRHLLLQQLQQQSGQEKTSVREPPEERPQPPQPPPNGVRVLPPGEKPSDCSRSPEEEQLVTRLQRKVEELEEKLVDQTQEGATDLEKQLELLVVENQRLKQELNSCRSPHCTHSQDAESLRREVSRWESQARQRERRLAELERDLLEKSSRVESLHRQLEESTRQLEESTRLQEEARTRQQEAEQKLSIMVYEGEMERAQGQLEVEMQNLEEEKNRVIEEAFVRAESEMKAVHENLAGVRMNLLSLHPALRTLTSDYNCLKRQVQEFPFMLEKAIGEAKQEICQVISDVSGTNEELLRKYKREMNLRREVPQRAGNIRVFCRVRPVSQEEQDSADSKTMLSFDSEDDAVLYLCNKGKTMTFDLDKVFAPHATQEEVFQEVQSLVTSCIDGFNVCIFAYGQTGSGKTFTWRYHQTFPR
ncbi:hypothetical protein F7725_025748 [Dissostichus mawsoni]|uniref:Kinesin motor domain-containing protein n=1 Tax=Dissostichus mawsoni TaxID=36200 RepID=A0A7J5X5J1_DISMA|nr:hypothetical protein F7725_025748 [Dissostichus mawsoni]